MRQHKASLGGALLLSIRSELKSKTVRRGVMEMALIVFGVLIALTLDSLLEDPSAGISTDSLLYLAQSLWWFQPFQPVTTVYDEFRTTIGPGEMTDPALRRALFELETARAEAAYHDDFLLGATLSVREPVLNSGLPDSGASDRRRRLLPSQVELAADLSCRNVVTARGWIEETLADSRRAVADAARSVGADGRNGRRGTLRARLCPSGKG